MPNIIRRVVKDILRESKEWSREDDENEALAPLSKLYITFTLIQNL